jgi:hypothetical protein
MLNDRLFRKFVGGYFNLRVDGWVFGSNLTHGPQKGLHSFGNGCIILQWVGLMIQPNCFMVILSNPSFGNGLITPCHVDFQFTKWQNSHIEWDYLRIPCSLW